ncbi:hypothetical protein CR205_05245 [Alteribacter lacisalsi]|jgi:hypothetical protein|uniref:Uncharacterized protein n=1 Tax=Alteribacter lacisalsi TaxID=2045244 RepID=A0A2W0HLN0_9BACI|nr:hypothetical protein [Alteribacter lacisalsi]PYZ98002.1 hypothetical protein CR205_05245 [Alteribacter lacisalsi]
MQKDEQLRYGLLVDGLDEYMDTYRQEIAEEFGVFRSVGESDQITQNATKSILDRMKKDKK